jgi:gliding motility-associated-like protein
MKYLYLINFYVFIFFTLCDAQQYTWVQKAPFPGTPRGAAVGFSIGSDGYVGTGFNTAGSYFNNFYKWDKVNNSWSQIASLPASPRYAGVGFSIGNYGFVGTGWSASLNQLNDFWKYDPSTNSWSAIATFPGSARYTSSVCVLNGKVYFGLGYNPLFNDFWEYDPGINLWTQKASFPGGARQSAVAFTLGNYVYFLTGNNGSNLNDMYRYDPITDNWTQKANFPGNPRYGAVAMEINGKAVVGTGGDGSTFFTDFYEYDASKDTWCQIQNLPAVGRRHVAQFSIGNSSYLATGVTSSNGSGVADLWELNSATPTFIAYSIPCNLMVSFNNAIPNVTAYHWDFGDGNSSNVANPYHTYSAYGNYNVQLIVYYNCGSDTINQQVTLTGNAAVSQFGFQQSPCSYNINFTNTSTGATSYLWNFGDGTTSTDSIPYHIYANPGIYSVTQIAYNNCDIDTITKNVTVDSILVPVASFSYTIKPCSGSVNFISTAINATSYLWQFGDGQTSTQQNPSHTFSVANTYPVTLTVNAGQPCTDSVVTIVNIENADSTNWFVPNCFTPNGDGINDVFEIIGISECSTYSFIIFNRWGQKVFETTDTLNSWNGALNSKNVSEGVYLYILTVNGQKSSGTVSLLR